VAARGAGVGGGARRAATLARHPVAEAGAGGGAAVAGGGVAGVGVLKLGLAAVCVAGAVGSYGVCARLGVLPGVGLLHPRSLVAITRVRARSHRDPRPSSRPATPPREKVAVSVAHSAPPPERAAQHARVPAVVQIRREFGAPPAHEASSGGPALTARPASASSASAATLGPATTAEVSQTRAEFGFEK
jgi:hypothetical protein